MPDDACRSIPRQVPGPDGTSFHPWVARYAVEDFRDECPMLRWAAFAVVERLVLCGESGYDGRAE
jgi:hypothetical protein